MKLSLYRIIGGASLLAFALASFGCVPELFYGMAKRKKALGEGGRYRQSIQYMLAQDEEFPETAAAGDGYVGRIPSSLEDGSSDDRVALSARGVPRKSVTLIFGGVDDGRICFLHGFRDEVSNTGEGEIKRVDDIARSYKLVAELAGPLTSPEVTKRDLKPAPGATVLDEVETIGVEDYTTDSGKQYVFVKQRRCGRVPAKPKGTPAEWLTVLVTPSNSAEDADAYLIAWQVLPGDA